MQVGSVKAICEWISVTCWDFLLCTNQMWNAQEERCRQTLSIWIVDSAKLQTDTIEWKLSVESCKSAKVMGWAKRTGEAHRFLRLGVVWIYGWDRNFVFWTIAAPTLGEHKVEKNGAASLQLIMHAYLKQGGIILSINYQRNEDIFWRQVEKENVYNFWGNT